MSGRAVTKLRDIGLAEHNRARRAHPLDHYIVLFRDEILMGE
jgi:hypothetical protein